LQDAQDNLFVELAVASQSADLITSNIRDFRSGSLALLTNRILTPAAFLKKWRNIG
jgi:predicted nucleic acid-binding protein